MDTLHTYRFYEEGPQRQLSIFDVFEFQEIYSYEDERQFEINFEHWEYGIGVNIEYKEQKASIDFSEYTSCTYAHLIGFLSTFINIYHKFPDEDTSVNVFCRSSGFLHFGDISLYPNAIITEHTRYCNDDGPNSYTIDVKERAHRIRVLVRKNPDLVYEDDWFYHLSDYEFSLEHKLKPKAHLDSCVLLAVELSPRTLLYTVYNAVQKLIAELGDKTYTERFGNIFPHDLVLKLKQLIDRQ